MSFPDRMDCPACVCPGEGFKHDPERCAWIKSVTPAPKPGDRILNGGEPGVLVRCPQCGGSGLLHKPDKPLKVIEPIIATDWIDTEYTPLPEQEAEKL